MNWHDIDVTDVPTPCYICDETALQHNLEILDEVQKSAHCKIILALKAFAMFSVFPLLRRYLQGAAASSLNEARLAAEEFGGEVHVCAPAYKDSEFDQLLSYATHITFNSFSQWQRFGPRVKSLAPTVKCAIRINPQHSEVPVPMYDPCSRYSRLGVTAGEFHSEDLAGISGLHFHTLSELGTDALDRTLKSVESQFDEELHQMDWMNFGGGQHITQHAYDRAHLCNLVRRFQKQYGLTIYLEPGEAVVLNAGVLIASVLDIVHNEMEIAILDASAAAHMPDVLEMPYRPEIMAAGDPGLHEHTYRLAGPTCLAGDIIGDYSFPTPLRVGSKVILLDMAHYTMVKNNSFNGVRLPSLALRDSSGEIRVLRRFEYEDYRKRLC